MKSEDQEIIDQDETIMIYFVWILILLCCFALWGLCWIYFSE